MARPIERDHSMCPECHQPTAYYDGHFRANRCTRAGCKFHEPVEQAQMMTKWDIIDLITNDKDVREAVLKIIKDKSDEVMAEVEVEAEAELDLVEDEQEI